MSLSEHILPTPPKKSMKRKSNADEWKKTKDKRKRPVTDACSKCIELREKIKVEQNHITKKHSGDDWDQREDLQIFKSLITENEGITEEEVLNVEEYCEGH
ncbi:hypothetical protein J6590_094798 [Homalodisca vitripennis]|nr:hypothetical protein J6590_094798 [Homalodisca vitripennis]